MKQRRSRKVRLESPPPGLSDFWCLVHVKLFKPIEEPVSLEGTPIQGYWRQLGIRAAPERVQTLIAGAVNDGAVVWGDTEWELVDPRGLDRKIRARIEPVQGEGIWFESGRVFHADPVLERAH